MSNARQESERIVAAAQEWLFEAGAGAHGGLSTGAAECGVCPLCRLIAVVRDTDPDHLAGLVETAATAVVGLVDVLRGVVDSVSDAVGETLRQQGQDASGTDSSADADDVPDTEPAAEETP